MAMTKAQLIKAVQQESGYTRDKAVPEIITALEDVIKKALARGEDVQVGNIGKFKPVHRPAGKARNPATGDMIDVPAKNVVKFRIGKSIKDAIL